MENSVLHVSSHSVTLVPETGVAVTLPFEDGVQGGTLCTFFISSLQTVNAATSSTPPTRQCLAVLHGHCYLYIYSQEGSVEDVTLPFSASRVVALSTGVFLQRRVGSKELECATSLGHPYSMLFPTWFSLFHPLEEPQPVALGSPAHGFPSDPGSFGPYTGVEELVGSVDGPTPTSPRLLLTRDPTTHSIIVFTLFGSRAHVSLEGPTTSAGEGNGGSSSTSAYAHSPLGDVATREEAGVGGAGVGVGAGGGGGGVPMLLSPAPTLRPHPLHSPDALPPPAMLVSGAAFTTGSMGSAGGTHAPPPPPPNTPQ